MVLVSNRGPLSFTRTAGGLTARRGAGGLVSGLAPLVAGTDTTWIAAALSDGDRAASAGGIIEADGLRVRTLAIDPLVLRQAYDVICNSTLWFLHHGLHDLSRRPVIDSGWHEAWASYRSYNRSFADVVVDEAPDDSIVLIQDYHLTLLGPTLSQRRPDLTTVHFSHTPFAPPMQMRVLPHGAAAELLEGMAAHHACGFHSRRWAADFEASCLDTIGRHPPTFVAPLAPDAHSIAAIAGGTACQAAVADIERTVGDRQMILRVDRIELSKNLLRGLRSYDTMLAARPDLRGRVVFRSLGYPSREGLPEYLAYRQEVEALADVVNRRWDAPGWTPVELDMADDFPRSVAHLRRYDVLLVNPIRDGLNLVAKEGPIVNERQGTLILSREAGIHDELDGAVISVNPYDIEEQARALATALDRTPAQRAVAATELRQRALSRAPADWLSDQLRAAERSWPSDSTSRRSISSAPSGPATT